MAAHFSPCATDKNHLLPGGTGLFLFLTIFPATSKTQAMNASTPISAIMTTKVITVAPNENMGRVRDLFHEHNIHHLPVVENGQVAGIISKTDYLMLLHGFTLFNTKESRAFNDTVANTLLVGEVMSRSVAFVNPEDSAEVAVGMFRENRFHAMPVVEKHSRRLLGIVTVMDLLNFAFANPELIPG